MENISFNVTPFQALLAVVFQAWIIVFPVMIMRKIDRLARLIEDRLPDADEGDSA